jgi:hypothetical protein
MDEDKSIGRMPTLMRARWAAIGAAIAVSVGAGGIGLAYATSSTPSLFHALTPARVFDTRDGTGNVPAVPIAAGGTIDVVVGGTSGIPVDATAVVFNVTVVNGTGPSFLTAWPTGDAKPNASALNWTDASATPNAVTVGLGTNGKVSFFNKAGTVNVFADVVGYYSAPAPAAPAVARVSFFGVPLFSNASSEAWETVYTSTPIVLPAGNVLARFGAESYCSATYWCSVRIQLDGAEMESGSGASGPFFAFDDGSAANANSAYEAHMMERFAANVVAGSHIVTVQMYLHGASTGQTFRLDDATLTVSAIG